MNYFLADWGSELQQELSCSFPFQKYEGRVDLLGAKQWKTGRAIQIFVSKENVLRFVPKSNWLVLMWYLLGMSIYLTPLFLTLLKQCLIQKQILIDFLDELGTLHFLTFEFDTLNREKSMEW